MEEILHCSLEGGPSWTQPVDNLTLLAKADMRHDLSEFVRGRYPAFLLSSYLHEGMHHWCFGSPLGTTAALLWLRNHRTLFCRNLDDGERDWDIVDDFLRYQSIMRMLRPLAEGMALFAEYDLSPGPSEVAPSYFTLGSMVFTESLDVPVEQRIETMDNRFRNLLLNHRLGDGLHAKASMLCHPFNLSKGGYLQGYLLIKMLHLRLTEIDRRMFETAFFISFLRSYIYQDMAFIGKIIDPGLRDQQIPAAAFDAFQEKMSRLIHISKRDIDDFERFYLTKATDTAESESSAFPTYGSTTAERDIGYRYAMDLVDEVYSEDGNSEQRGLKVFHAAVINHRHLFRLGSTSMLLEVRNDRVICFADEAAHSDRRLIFSGPALPGIQPGIGAGRVEFWVSPTTSRNFVLFARGDELIATMSGNTESEAEANAEARFVITHGRGDRQELERQVLEALGEGSAKETMTTSLRLLDEALERKYALLACPASVQDITAVVDVMRPRGFFGALGKDADQVRLLALYSMSSTNLVKVDHTLLEEHGLHDPALLNALERNLRKWDLDLLRGHGVSRFTFRV